ncbi:MAG: DUF3108 domain-containing protein [Betaproteobacteria bacterium]|nr:DUF3108 domain-containing protein [Betaproteobacteria bacterium]
MSFIEVLFNHIKLVSFALLLSIASQASAQQTTRPTHIQATYEVTKNGQPFARVKEQFIVSENGYKIESVTKGVGVYSLLGDRMLASSGEVAAQGLKPARFELRQGDNAKKFLLSEFDWTHQTLRMTVKGKVKETPLAEGTQDLASYAYQFMFLPAPIQDAINVTLTTGKKVNQYQYKVASEHENVEAAGIRYKTLHLMQSDQQDKTETKELWLAVEQYHLPVRILMVDENGQKLEQTLTELHVE